MLLKINKALVYFIVICFIAMTIPYFIDFGLKSLFLRDFYAKRIMTLLTAPFFLFIVFLVYQKKVKTLSKNVTLYILVFFIVLINSILYRNNISLIVLDTFIVLLPVFFYLLIFKTNFEIDTYKKYFPVFLVIACILVVFNVKLQFSYFSLLGIVYLIFLTKTKASSLILVLFLPLLLINTLIGKSSLIMLAFMVVYFFLYDKKLISKQKKIYLALIPSLIIIIGSIVFWDVLEETGAYKNTVYFFRHADFNNLKFTDMSTGHRIYEAQQVLLNFKESNFYINLFGNGFGATIDLSGTKDVSVKLSNPNLKSVRHIHIGFFAILYRFGLVGVMIYFLFIRKVYIACKKTLKKSEDYSIILGALYVLILIFDSFISFPHMASNFMFWLITFIIIKESENV